ncbi:MAG: sugar O-acetyltransferase [Dysgonomonas sp.]|nr:sugar O-acetyltransferase [Dysgonomonas sp.]
MKTKEDKRTYSSSDVLEDQIEHTQVIVQAYNHLYPSETKKKSDMLKLLFDKIGKKSIIEQPFFCYYGKNISIGENSYANESCIFYDKAKISIGNNVIISTNVEIYTAMEPVKKPAQPVTIGDNVWIGGCVKIYPGVSIGENSLIVAGSKVKNDIPPNTIAMGDPAKVVKEIEDVDEVDD